MSASLPVFAAALCVAGAGPLWVLLPLWNVLSIGWIGIAYALLQSLVNVHMRSTAIALQYVLTNLIGIGFGAPLVGMLSEALHPSFGANSLRDAMLATYSLTLLGVAALLACATCLNTDLARMRSGVLAK
jgi:hypothetical protein